MVEEALEIGDLEYENNPAAVVDTLVALEDAVRVALVVDDVTG